MSRILEFQPTDEQTVIARVLLDLHQAIDANFPGANPSARQFSKTVLTHQSESTRIDNTPPSKSESEVESQESPGQKLAERTKREKAELSMTPRAGYKSAQAIPTLHTEEMRELLGESPFSRGVKTILIFILLVGIAMLIWLVFLRPETISDFN